MGGSTGRGFATGCGVVLEASLSGRDKKPKMRLKKLIGYQHPQMKDQAALATDPAKGKEG